MHDLCVAALTIVLTSQFRNDLNLNLNLNNALVEAEEQQVNSNVHYQFSKVIIKTIIIKIQQLYKNYFYLIFNQITVEKIVYCSISFLLRHTTTRYKAIAFFQHCGLRESFVLRSSKGILTLNPVVWFKTIPIFPIPIRNSNLV